MQLVALLTNIIQRWEISIDWAAKHSIYTGTWVQNLDFQQN